MTYVELFFSVSQFTEEIRNGVIECFVWCVIGRGLYSQDELVLKGMRHFVSGKHDVGVFDQLPANTISHSVRTL